MILRPPRSTQSRSSAASDVYKRQEVRRGIGAAERVVEVASRVGGRCPRASFCARGLRGKSTTPVPVRSPRAAPWSASAGGCGWKRKSGTPLALAVWRGHYCGWRVAFWCAPLPVCCLLYTSDAADDLLCVDLGGGRI